MQWFEILAVIGLIGYAIVLIIAIYLKEFRWKK